MTFVLDGKGSLPRPPPPFRITAIPDPEYNPNDALAGQGAEVFGRRCATCHGVGAVAAGGAPDLRTSPIPRDRAAFAQVVSEGLSCGNAEVR